MWSRYSSCLLYFCSTCTPTVTNPSVSMIAGREETDFRFQLWPRSTLTFSIQWQHNFSVWYSKLFYEIGHILISFSWFSSRVLTFFTSLLLMIPILICILKLVTLFSTFDFVFVIILPKMSSFLCYAVIPPLFSCFVIRFLLLLTFVILYCVPSGTIVVSILVLLLVYLLAFMEFNHRSKLEYATSIWNHLLFNVIRKNWK